MTSLIVHRDVQVRIERREQLSQRSRLIERKIECATYDTDGGCDAPDPISEVFAGEHVEITNHGFTGARLARHQHLAFDPPFTVQSATATDDGIPQSSVVGDDAQKIVVGNATLWGWVPRRWNRRDKCGGLDASTSLQRDVLGNHPRHGMPNDVELLVVVMIDQRDHIVRRFFECISTFDLLGQPITAEVREEPAVLVTCEQELMHQIEVMVIAHPFVDDEHRFCPMANANMTKNYRFVV